jgi:PAS domain S-box-containing protein
MATASSFLLALGGVLGFISLAFPSETSRSGAAVAGVAACAIVLSLLPVAVSGLPQWAFELLTASGTLLVGAGLFFGGTTAYEFFYFWVAIYAAYFFPPARAGAQIALLLVSYPLAEQLGQGQGPSGLRWVIAAGTIGIAAATVAVLKRSLLGTSSRLQAMTDALPLGSFELDADGCVVRWNQAAEELFGWRGDEVIGRRLPVRAERGERRLLLDYLASASSLAGYELTCERKDRSTFRASIFYASAGEEGRLGSVVLVADVSEEKELQQQLAERSKMEAIGRLAGGIAHDFNNLLLVIRSQLWLLSEQRGPSAEIAAIGNAVEDAAKIVSQLLTFARREEALEPDIIDLAELLEEVEHLLGPVIGEDIELVRPPSDAGAAVLADRTQLELIAVNLVLNARDALPSGGRIELAAEAAVRDGSRWARLRVSDNGVGIDPRDQQRIFEPFYTTKGRGRGTGLGLSVVHELVAQNGGEIELSSEPGSGTTFNIYLPHIAASPRALSQDDELQEAPLTDGMETVLLADDEDDVRESLQRALERYGYRVLAAPDAETALAIGEDVESAIDVVVTDVVMPAMSGFELARRLRQRDPDVPIVFISGYPDEAILAGPSHALAFLPKPFAPPELAKTIRRALTPAVQAR